MRQYSPVILFALFFFSISCSEEVDISLPDIEIKPVVNCLFTKEEPFVVSVHLPATAFQSEFPEVEDANVMISGDDGSNYQLSYQEDGKYINDQAIPKAGVLYTLNIAVNGFQPVSAQDKLPVTNTQITGYIIEERDDSDPINGPMEGGVHMYQNIELRLYNDIEVADYMGISVVHNRISHPYHNGTTTVEIEHDKYIKGYIESSDLVVSSEGMQNYDDLPVLLFRDQLFESEHELINIKVYTELAYKFWLKLYSYSPNCFQFFKTWFIHDNTKAYDFWEVYEPIEMYSNINNGYGIFAGYVTQDYVLTGDDYTNPNQ